MVVQARPTFVREHMGFAHFIARRILVDKDRQDRLSRPIVLIAVLGIVIGMAVMILTVGISTGFQREVRAKVTGAGSHIEIVPLGGGDTRDSERMTIEQPFYPWLDTVPGVARISVFALKPGIVETENEIEGVVVKGLGADHDWTFLRRHLVRGGILPIPDTAGMASALISNWLAKRLRQGTGDTVTIYLVRDSDEPRARKFLVRGIYETGIEKIDQQLVFVDIAHIQRFAQWGLRAEMSVYDTVSPKGIRIEGHAFGGVPPYEYEWPGTALKGRGPHWISTSTDTTITLVTHDIRGTIPDTAWIRIAPGMHAPGQRDILTRTLANITRGGSGGSYGAYCGGFEVALNDHRDLMAMDDLIYNEFLDPDQRTITALQRFPEIFTWLDLLDTNVVVVIVLMVVVAIINMTSALLIIILERTNMIGTLKALGTGNGTICRIFLIDAAYILGIGIILGDILGIGLAMLQKGFGIVRLPVESDYVDTVPVALDPLPIALLNAGTLLVCVLALMIPSMLVTRIAPARAVRFA